jgi:hypothetical protein
MFCTYIYCTCTEQTAKTSFIEETVPKAFRLRPPHHDHLPEGEGILEQTQGPNLFLRGPFEKRRGTDDRVSQSPLVGGMILQTASAAGRHSADLPPGLGRELWKASRVVMHILRRSAHSQVTAIPAVTFTRKNASELTRKRGCVAQFKGVYVVRYGAYHLGLPPPAWFPCSGSPWSVRRKEHEPCAQPPSGDWLGPDGRTLMREGNFSKASIVKDQIGSPSRAARNQPSKTAGPISTRFGATEFGKDKGGVTRRGHGRLPTAVASLVGQFSKLFLHRP